MLGLFAKIYPRAFGLAAMLDPRVIFTILKDEIGRTKLMRKKKNNLNQLG